MSARQWAFLRWVLCALLWSHGALPSSTQADSASEARMAFERGVEASREQRWADAKREFERSRALVVKPSTLFNLAVADLKLGLVNDALAALDSFERLASPSEHATMLERAVLLRAEAERGRDAARPAVERARGLLAPAGLSSEAQRYFDDGRNAYARGEDQQALEWLSAAHRLSGKDELLYDIGVVADRLREDERAIRAFENFVAACPELPEAELAQRHLERLRKLQAQKNAPQPASTITERSDELTSPTPVSPAPPLSLAGPRALLVVGSLLIGAAVGGAVWWDDRGDNLNACNARREDCTNHSQLTLQKRVAMATTLISALSGAGFVSAGATLLARRKRIGLSEAGLSVGRGELLLRAGLVF